MFVDMTQLMGRVPTQEDVDSFIKSFPLALTRRYDPWCDERGIDVGLMRELVARADKVRLAKEKAERAERYRNGEIEPRPALVTHKPILEPKSDGANFSRQFNRRDTMAKLIEQGGACACCDKKLKAEIACGDHIIPHSRGGPTEIWNLQALCQGCNQMKKDKDPLIWAWSFKVTLPDGFEEKYYKWVKEDKNGVRYWVEPKPLDTI